MNRRANRLLVTLGAALLFLPAVADNYLLSIVTLFLFFAYVGQAWNIMMGFAGQLSLGHALYLGVGGYAAAALYFHFGIGPWAGLWLAVMICALLASLIGALAFRYGVAGVYFTLLTIAFAEFTRVGFDHFAWVGGSGGMFLKVAERDQMDLIHLRGTPAMFYYVILSLAAAAFALSAWLVRSRAGYYWRAIRDNEDAAEALGIHLFRWKMLAIITSSAMTALGGVFSAFYSGNLFPEQIFNISRSIEILLGPIIGGVGTLFGPVLGAAVLTILAESTTDIVAALGWEAPGVKQLIYGILLFVVIVFLPQGVWPALARKLKVTE
ncbi:MAG TPA: branched-chain amino acid ABC transporter permease [Candidatus Binatia bacterium]